MRDPVIIGPDPTSIKLYDMFEWPVSFDDNYFHHLSQLTQPDYDYHDAYDADEDFTLFRADAVFTNGGEDYTVPVFASKDKTGKWKWFIRFRPHRTGSWRLRVRVLCRHPHPADSSGEKDAERISLKDKKTKYYEHEFGYKSDDFSKHPSAERRFTVNNDAKLAGPLETPDRTKKDNQNYFYRWTEEGGEYKRRPFFLLGAARPWVVPNRDPHWDSVLDREKELFLPMRDAGCNALYHWMAPWETQLVHQSEFEWWPNSPTSGKPILVEKGVPPPRGVSFTPFPSVRGADKHRRYEFGYRRYDQGRALQTDLILSLATRHNTLVPPDDAGHPLFTDTILLFFSVLPHQSLQDPEHHWGEWGWSHGPRRETLDPSKVYGYQQFKIFDPGPDNIHQGIFYDGSVS